MMGRLSDVEASTQLRLLLGHESCTNSVAFSPDGIRIASGSDGGTARFWGAQRRVTRYGYW